MRFDPKIAFENDFNNLFDEIWLVRTLYNFWEISWDDSCIQPGMMFRFRFEEDGNNDTVDPRKKFATNLNNSATHINMINILKRVNGPFIVTKFVSRMSHGEIYFQPVLFGNKKWEWELTWKIFRVDGHNYVHNTQMYDIGLWVEIISIE
jgi:hypothetical protein